MRDFLTKKLPNFQIITTTHSPLTAQQCGAGELFILHRIEENAPPKITQFEGEPRRLKIQQLIASPMFGLDTTASKYVEELRKSYVELKDTKSLKPNDQERLQKITDELSDITDTTNVDNRERQQQELLTKINNALKK